MASTSGAFLRMTARTRRPWTMMSLGKVGAATTAGVATTVVASAVALEAYAEWQEHQVISSHMNSSSTTSATGNSTTTAVQREEILAAGNGLPRFYDRQQIRSYWLQRPVSVAKRVGEILFELGPLAVKYYLETQQHQLLPQQPPRPIDSERTEQQGRSETEQAEADNLQQLQYYAQELREALTNLGPAFVKGGQQLAIRPDLVPSVVLKELQKLCDSVRPVPDEIALQLLREELEIDDLSLVFGNLHLVASASLGQVYQARLLRPTSSLLNQDDPSKQKQSGREEGPLVAIKVQRPGMRKAFSLDLFLLQQWGDFMDTFTSLFTQQKPYHRAFFDAFAQGSYSEMDYENEARNQKHFQEEFRVRGCKVKVPNVYDEYSTQRILTTEWIQGVKLADSPKDTIRELIPVGVELFLTQLLDIGAFHSDPHPGNLLVTEDGVLCLLDYGLTAEVDPVARDALTNAIVHLLYRDFDSLVSHDAKQLGFLPHDFDTSELKPILIKVLTGGVLETGSDLRKRKRKLQDISNELNEIFFRYPFQVPPFFALVTRGLGLLEGIALTGDPEFDIFRASVPYATRRAVGLMGRHMTNRRRKTSSSSPLGIG